VRPDDSAAPACDGIPYYNSCYYYGDALEQVTSDGGGMTFDIESPLNFEGEDGGHSIDEIAVETGGGSLTDVEMGWSVSGDQWGDTDPHLFVYHWINGAETCYNTCAWNQYGSTYYPGMSLSSLVGKPVYMGWIHANSAWWAWFNDEWLGYISDSEWSGAFTQAGLIQWYGEIASSNGVPPRSQMGNGLFAENAASATMATMCSADATNWVCGYGDGQSTSATDATYYGVLNHSSYGAARYGGPGQTGTLTPEVTVTPAFNSIAESQSLGVTVSLSGGAGNPFPTGAVKLSSGGYISAKTALNGGSALITVPAEALSAGKDMLTVTYTPNAISAPTYSSASGTAVVAVTSSAYTPKVTIAVSSPHIVTTQRLAVTATVHAAAGQPMPEGTAKLTSGTYSSKPLTLSSGLAAFAVPAETLAAGADKLTVTYTPDTTSSKIYNHASGVAAVTVSKAAQSIVFIAPKSPVTYGAKPISLIAKASSGLPATVTVLSGPAKVSGAKLTMTGAGKVTLEAKQAGNAYYEPASDTIAITVLKAKLTVTANNLTMVQGATVPTLTYKISGFVNGDTQAKAFSGKPALTTSAMATSTPGPYAIKVTAGTLAAKNYTFTYVNGTLTIE
jgi:hypothetical protein